MKLTTEQENFILSILNQLTKRKICFQCGGEQTHSLVYCKHCGGTYKGENLTRLDAFNISKHRDLQYEPVVNSPRFIAAIYRRKLEPYGLTDEDFRQYVEEKYDLKEKDFRPDAPEWMLDYKKR
jgi:hypothetical protein